MCVCVCVCVCVRVSLPGRLTGTARVQQMSASFQEVAEKNLSLKADLKRASRSLTDANRSAAQLAAHNTGIVACVTPPVLF